MRSSGFHASGMMKFVQEVRGGLKNLQRTLLELLLGVDDLLLVLLFFLLLLGGLLSLLLGLGLLSRCVLGLGVGSLLLL